MRTVSHIEFPFDRSLVFTASSSTPGPTVVVVAGHHGDEPAGYAAAGILAEYATVERGSLVVVPNANPLACVLHSRYGGAGESDLNRCYDLPPGHRDADCAGAEHARALLKIVLDANPTLVVDLHETRVGHDAVPDGRLVWAMVHDLSSASFAEHAGLHVQTVPSGNTFTSACSDRCTLAVAVETVKVPNFGTRVRLHLDAVRRLAQTVGLRIEVDPAAVSARIGDGT